MFQSFDFIHWRVDSLIGVSEPEEIKSNQYHAKDERDADSGNKRFEGRNNASVSTFLAMRSDSDRHMFQACHKGGVGSWQLIIP